MEGEVPTLLSLKDMLDNGLDISIQQKRIKYGDRHQELYLHNYFLIHKWAPDEVPFVFYTFKELQRIHTVFGHPSIKATRHLLRRAADRPLDRETKRSIQQIIEDCKTCTERSASPRRFKLTIGTANMRFNHEVQVDTMWINSKPVVHMVDTATHFTAARFINNQSSMEVWKAIRRMWTLLYCGPPDFLAIDQGSNYTSKEFRAAARNDGINIREAPIETPGAIGIVERYHAPLRRAYNTLRDTLDKTISNNDCLLMATFAVNSVTGPEGLCPMLLVYGAIPRPARMSIAPTQYKRAEAIDEAMNAVIKEQALRKIKFGLSKGGGPRAVEDSAELRKLPAGALVWVYRTSTKKWGYPHRFISIDGETVVVQTSRARRLFRSTCVKPYIKSQLHEVDKAKEESTEAMITIPPVETNFEEARQQELKGLLDNETFIAVSRNEVPDGVRIFGSRFIDELKRSGSGTRKKSRLVAQNYQDVDAGKISTKAPTVNRFSQRLLLALAPSIPKTRVFSRDITQAYVQSNTKLERQVYIKAPKEMGLPDGWVLKIMKPLYGIPESGLHWYLTYLDHHLNELNMKRTRTDPCVLVKHRDGTLDGFIVLQVDDSLGFGTPMFLAEEEKASSRFKCKPRTYLDKSQILFNGLCIKQIDKGLISMTQEEKIDKVKHPTTEEEFASQRALAQYIGVCSRPDICAAVQLLAPGSEPTTPAEMKQFSKAVKHLHDTSTIGLKFKGIDMTTARITILSDAAFGNARGLKSQLGYLILLTDEKGTANIIHYASNKCKRVTRSVLAAELHAFVLAFDYAYVLKDMITEIIGRELDLIAYIDSKTLFDVVAKDSNTTEKRLQIDIHALRENYSNKELKSLNWIPGIMNPANSLTKAVYGSNNPLWDLMMTNKLVIQPIGWAERAIHTNPKSLECQSNEQLD